LTLNILAILDEVTEENAAANPVAVRDHTVEQFWHFGVAVEARGDGSFLLDGGRARLVLEQPADDVVCGRGGEHGWRSRVFGQCEEAPVIVVRRRGRLPVRLGAAIVRGAGADVGNAEWFRKFFEEAS
jgi:hypothetical protein